ncbi:MAG: UDP-glucose/GDP-mannose dehydrogenase family protein [Paludibacteraceae bacterium]|nr:UDP-glucose/GDP-mannose dehydrogenase family protein [Paludibacteraceae bacterium]
MEVSIFGLGYVGCVGAACLAKLGHKVIGVDVSENKVRLMNEGKPTIIEEGIAELCQEAHEKGLMCATTDVNEAIQLTKISFIVVGTPSSKEGHLNLNYIYAVARQIGEALRVKRNRIEEAEDRRIEGIEDRRHDGMHIIAIRSTVLPGTNEKVGQIIAEASGLERGTDFTVVSNPEFLREGTSVEDYFNPPLTLIGTDSPYAEQVFRELYQGIHAEFICTDIKVAEMMKYVNNTYHALKIVFGNEVGNICKGLNVDSHKVMEIFCKDKQLNISPYYFKPGFAYGGSCLPKDMKALKTLAHDLYIDVPVIESIFESNELQKKRAVQLIMAQGKRKVGILGLSFKAGTDDLRCSPIVDVVESLLGKGFEIRIYDKNVKVSELTGTNKDFIMAKIPHLQHFVTDNLDEVCSQSDVLVITNKEKDFKDVLVNYPNKIIIDLVRQWKDVDYAGKYEGISWGDININRLSQDSNDEKDFKQTEF